MKTYTIWMGYDPREKLAYDVAKHSILSRTDPFQVEVRPIDLKAPNVTEILDRPIQWKDGRMWCPISQAPMATEFAVSRFCAFFWPVDGWSLFVDSDIVAFTDIRGLFKELDDRYAVMCVKHKPHGKDGEIKMDDQLQTFYARKNWSSVLAINAAHPANKRFTLRDLNERPGRDLHAFYWLKDEKIGALDHRWNALVGVDDLNKLGLGIMHFTLGGPWLPNWQGGPCDQIWNGAHEAYLSSCKSAETEKAPSYG
jgi:hypothetical protein